jgi:8-oxo-dGTP pyrophosphatase MutT (NUDIX family)
MDIMAHKIIPAKTKPIEAGDVAHTVSVIYSGTFNIDILCPVLLQYKPHPVIQSIINSNYTKWSAIQANGKPRFTNEMTSGLGNIIRNHDGSMQIQAVMYPFYAKLAGRGKDVTDPEQLEWLKKQHESAGPDNFTTSITYPFACALLVKFDNNKGFILQERSAAGAQNVGKITASVTGSFDENDLILSSLPNIYPERIDLVRGAKRELFEERGISSTTDVVSFQSSMIVYENMLKEFIYVGVVETNLTDTEVMEKAISASDSWETNRVLLVHPENPNPLLIAQLRDRATPASRIAMYAGLKDDPAGLEFLRRLVS